MGCEVNLLRNYPSSNRDLSKRAKEKTPEDREIARQFGRQFFDGERKYGYGGFYYNEKFWQNVIPDFIEFYNLNDQSQILDVGCAKGFMLYDFKRFLPNANLMGIDVSGYAISNAKEEIKQSVSVGNANNLMFKDNTFDLVLSINTVHNLELKECVKALKEIQRVSKGNSFLTVDAFRNDEEKEKMFNWNLTAKTILSVDDWKSLFQDVGYEGDYYWFIP